MKLSLAEVKQIAYLARLLLMTMEGEKFRTELSEIIDYNARQLARSKKGSKLERFKTNTLGQSDKPRPSLPQADALSNAPVEKKGFFVVPKVLD
jgi:aspartyl/glutamyl-tRNA(Asn/Gln) amidotransferase C subunit